MPFYYLHPYDPEKTNNHHLNEMNFVCYKEIEIDGRLLIPNEPGVYCAHDVGVQRWEINDDTIETLGNLDVIKATFKKVHDQVGFTLWKRV